MSFQNEPLNQQFPPPPADPASILTMLNRPSRLLPNNLILAFSAAHRPALHRHASRRRDLSPKLWPPLCRIQVHRIHSPCTHRSTSAAPTHIVHFEGAVAIGAGGVSTAENNITPVHRQRLEERFHVWDSGADKGACQEDLLEDEGRDDGEGRCGAGGILDPGAEVEGGENDDAAAG